MSENRLSAKKFANFIRNQFTPSQKWKINGFLAKNLNFKIVYGQSRFTLPHKVLIGTHHKTGSVWLYSIFSAISNEYNYTIFSGRQNELPANYDLFFQNHSLFEFDKLDTPFRGVHMIRDPRDVVISGCFYHQKSDEEWLHDSRKDLQGRTYQEAINQLKTLDEQIHFEMEHAAKWNIEAMVAWNYSNPAFIELKYEDLIEDYDLFLFHKVFSFLGFPGSVLPNLLSIAYQNSLFSNQVKTGGHIRSGKPSQWKKYFNASHRERFVEIFGEALIELGYEENHNWIKE